MKIFQSARKALQLWEIQNKVCVTFIHQRSTFIKVNAQNDDASLHISTVSLSALTFSPVLFPLVGMQLILIIDKNIRLIRCQTRKHIICIHLEQEYYMDLLFFLKYESFASDFMNCVHNEF